MNNMSSAGSENDVEELRKRCEGLEEEKADFGQKRAMFMELFKQKEDELQQARSSASEAQNTLQTLQENLSKVQMELEDLKTATAISEVTKQDEIQEVREGCSQQIASMQRVMEDAVKQTEHRMSAQIEQERSQWLDMKERREEEVHGFRLGPDRDGFLSSVAKTLQKKVAAATPLSGSGGIQTDQDQENLEDSMKRAQEDTEILKSVVMPLEEEITTLKQKLRDAYGRLDELEDTKLDASVPSSDEVSSDHVDHKEKLDPAEPPSDEVGSDRADYKEKIKDLNDSLRTEKSSRTDLEMYVAVLNTQKAVLQDDTDKLRSELKEVCKLLEVERHEHNNLKNTWQMANDQYLEGQRHLMSDLRRMESVLSSEQQRQVSEMKRKDSEKEAVEKKAKRVDKQEALKDTESIHSAVSQDQSTEVAEDQADTGLVEEALGEQALLRSQSDLSLSSLGAASAQDDKSLEGRLLISEDSLRASPDRNLVIPSLTEAQEKAITDPTPESEASQQMLAQVRARSEVTVNLAGRRIVSEKEWTAMQQQVRAAREKLGKPCDMCQNYEEQLQAAQDAQRKSQSQVMTAERQLQAERQAVSSQTVYTEQLEQSLQTAAEQAHAQITLLVTKVDESEKYVVCLRQQLTQVQHDLQDHLKSLTENREEIHKELHQLQNENDELLGRHSQHAQQMQDECINLPNNIEDLQLLLLRHREEIIQAKVSKEHTEGTLKSEIMFLKDQLVSEQQEKATMEETLSQEISQLQEELATLHSFRSESERQSTLRSEAENKVKELESTLRSIQAKSKQLIGALQHQVEEQTHAKCKLETEVNRLRNKVSSLQVDLDNSEAVQRDFVKLSQSLQIQLERFRAGENDVRWQHEEDYDECVNCKQSFSVTRRKHHCKHCGKIFCADCISKVVNSGPNLRSSRVCDICHTMLVSEATPYFSTVPPQTPD